MTHETAQTFAVLVALAGGIVALLGAAQCAAWLVVRHRPAPARHYAPGVDVAPVWWTVDDLFREAAHRFAATADLQAELDQRYTELAAELHDDWSVPHG